MKTRIQPQCALSRASPTGFKHTGKELNLSMVVGGMHALFRHAAASVWAFCLVRATNLRGV